MAKYDLVFGKSADKEISSLDKAIAKRVWTKLSELKLTPFPTGCVKLSGYDLYRVRVGDYRIIYEVNLDLRLIIVIYIRHRKDAYRIL